MIQSFPVRLATAKSPYYRGPPPYGKTVHIAVATVWITMKPLPTLMHRLPTLRWKTSINELTTLTRFACLINFDKKLCEPPLRGNPLTIDPNSQTSHHSFSLILGLENTGVHREVRHPRPSSSISSDGKSGAGHFLSKRHSR